MKRRFWLSSGAIFLDEALYVALFPLLPFYATRLGLSKAEAGLLVASYPILMLVSSLPAGVLVDRIGSRRLLLWGSGLLVLASLGFGYSDQTWQLCVARAVQGLASGFTSVAGMALIAATAAPARRATAIGLATSLQGLSAFAGPAVGGFAAPGLGVHLAFLLPAAFGAIVFVAILWPGWREVPLASAAPIRASLTGLLRSPAVQGSAACILTCGLVGGSVQTLVPLRLSAAGFTTSDLGTLFLVTAAIGLVGVPVAGRLADRRGVARMTTVWCAAVSALVLGFAASAEAALAVSLVVLLWPLFRVGGTLGYALAAQHGPLGGGLAASYGFVLTAWSAGAVVGPLLAGAIADTAGDTVAFLVAAGAGALLTLGIGRSHRALRQECAVG